MLSIVCTGDDEQLLNDLLGPFRSIRPPERGFFLSFDDDVLRLCRAGDGKGICVMPEDIARRLTGQFLLGKACGLPAEGLKILDATGGLGVDAMALARKGARIDVVERVPMIWALLKDLGRRLNVSRARIRLADSASVLADDPIYDVIYLDPMFPQRRKKALPGKRMQYLGALLEQPVPDGDGVDAELLRLAQSRAQGRVVLKRRLKDPTIGAPDWTLKGKSVRYDVFRGRA